MDLTVDMLKIPRVYHRDRWLPIEANGRVGFNGWVQRPAADRNTARNGVGLYDAREKVIVKQPDAAERAERLDNTAAFHAGEAARARKTADEIRKLHDLEQANA